MDIIECCHHQCFASGDGDGVLVVCRGLSVAGAAGPAVALDHDVAAAHVHHWFDAYAHAFGEPGAYASASVVGHLGRFMHLAAYAVAAHLAHQAVAPFLAICLHGVGDVADAGTRAGGLDAFVERFACGAAQGKLLGADFAHGESVAAVAAEAVFLHHCVDAHDIAVAELVVGGETVDYRFVHFDAQGAGETSVAQAGRLATIVRDEFTGNGVELACGNSGFDPAGYFAKCARHQVGGGSHGFYFLGRFKINHLRIALIFCGRLNMPGLWCGL